SSCQPLQFLSQFLLRLGLHQSIVAVSQDQPIPFLFCPAKSIVIDRDPACQAMATGIGLDLLKSGHELKFVDSHSLVKSAAGHAIPDVFRKSLPGVVIAFYANP